MESFSWTRVRVILAGGMELFNARLKGEYGYGRWPNVITSLEYERILSEWSVPATSNAIRWRPWCRIAWIQCVGSRDSHLVRVLFERLLHVGHEASHDHPGACPRHRHHYFLY